MKYNYVNITYNKYTSFDVDNNKEMIKEFLTKIKEENDVVKSMRFRGPQDKIDIKNEL